MSNSKPLTKAQILAASDLKTEIVEVPEWGGSVTVRTMTAAERDTFEAGLVKGDGKARKTDFTNFRAKLVALTAVDPSGTRLFTDAEADQLGQKGAAPMQRLFEVAQRLNGLSQADVDDLTKNSSAAPSGASPSR
jgi:hypothetical protein